MGSGRWEGSVDWQGESEKWQTGGEDQQQESKQGWSGSRSGSGSSGWQGAAWDGQGCSRGGCGQGRGSESQQEADWKQQGWSSGGSGGGSGNWPGVTGDWQGYSGSAKQTKGNDSWLTGLEGETWEQSRALEEAFRAGFEEGATQGFSAGAGKGWGKGVAKRRQLGDATSGGAKDRHKGQQSRASTHKEFVPQRTHLGTHGYHRCM